MMASQQAIAPSLRRSSAARHLGRFKFLSLGRTHVGCVRTLNEDAYLDRGDVGLWAVADGMGGHEGGEVASARVVEALRGVNVFGSAYGFRHNVCAALHDANDTLIDYALQRRAGTVGSTIASLMVYQGHFACVWAGDSRVYLYRNGEMRRLTRDHSVVQAMVDAGQLGQDKARTHARANVITRAVGAHEMLELESVHGRIQSGDRFLICSDGLTGVLGDGEIGELMRRSPLEASVEGLINRALARGAPDNVTVVVVRADEVQGGQSALG